MKLIVNYNNMKHIVSIYRKMHKILININIIMIILIVQSFINFVIEIVYKTSISIYHLILVNLFVSHKEVHVKTIQ